MTEEIKKVKQDMDRDNSEQDSKLEQIEQKLNLLSANITNNNLVFNNSYSSNDEIDLRELWDVIWQGKWVIIITTFLFAVASVFYALSLPNTYKSEGLYAPTKKQSGTSISGQLGSLASLAGVNIGGGESNDIDQAIALITSWPFLEKVVDKHDLKPLIMGVKGWNPDAGTLIWDEEIYNPMSQKWMSKESMSASEPSSYEVYARFSKMLTVNFDKKKTMMNIGVEYYSPVIAQEWVSILVDEINEAFRVRDMAESKKNIDYLEQKIVETSIAEMQTVFYSMIKSQMQTLMLAEVDKQYLFKQVVEPKVAERKHGPAKIIICVMSSMVGGVLGSLIVIFWGLRKSYND